MSNSQRIPFWLWPNLLSLDAPLVAISWLHIFVTTFEIYWFPWQTYLVLFSLVWSIYAADRLVDASRLKDTHCFQPRHAFHLRHRPLIILLIGIALLVSFTQLIHFPASVLEYGIIALGLVIWYFRLASRQSPQGIPFLKNTVAGLTFGYGTSLCALIHLPQVTPISILSGNFYYLSEIVSFSMLCVLNITAIDFWQTSRANNNPEIKAEIEIAYAIGLLVLMIVMMTLCVVDQSSSRYFYYAVMIAISSLMIINKIRSRLSLDLLRVLADAALFLPFPLFFIMKFL